LAQQPGPEEDIAMRRPSHLLAGFVLISLAAIAWSAAPAKRCITVLYLNSPGVHFDFEYYKSHHIALIKRLYGRGIAKIELRRGVATQDGSPVTYIAVINIWIGSQKVFDDASAKHAKELIADVPNFTNGRPVIQFDEIVN
jgi:uncharacterized protein (TIGR02118 family)